MYHELSDRVMDKAFLKAKGWIKLSYRMCKSELAWHERNDNRFRKCTEELGESIPWIGENLKIIEEFAATNMNSTMTFESQIEQWMMDHVSLTHRGSHGLEIAIHFIKEKLISESSPATCFQLSGCQENVRKIILQLILIEWGVLGLGESAAGTFLANHYSALGPYFGSLDGHNWPHTPLSKDPSVLESTFHAHMTKMSEVLSNGTLKHISILDFPAFGSKIAWLKKQHKREANWPTEIDFSIRSGIDKKKLSLLSVFGKYKTLLSHWDNYMNMVYMKNPHLSFTNEMKTNDLFNFTKIVRGNLKEFLMVTHGSFLTAEKQDLPLWFQTANILFNQTRKMNSHMKKKSHYDKLIMECAFRRNLLTQRDFDHEGGCEFFNPTLTSNGLCYSFNSQTVSRIWKPTNLTNAFQDVFPTTFSNEVFFGAGKSEGKYK